MLPQKQSKSDPLKIKVVLVAEASQTQQLSQDKDMYRALPPSSSP